MDWRGARLDQPRSGAGCRSRRGWHQDRLHASKRVQFPRRGERGGRRLSWWPAARTEPERAAASRALPNGALPNGTAGRSWRRADRSVRRGCSGGDARRCAPARRSYAITVPRARRASSACIVYTGPLSGPIAQGSAGRRTGNRAGELRRITVPLVAARGRQGRDHGQARQRPARAVLMSTAGSWRSKAAKGRARAPRPGCWPPRLRARDRQRAHARTGRHARRRGDPGAAARTDGDGWAARRGAAVRCGACRSCRPSDPPGAGRRKWVVCDRFSIRAAPIRAGAGA
jgi:hypothetical protein